MKHIHDMRAFVEDHWGLLVVLVILLTPSVWIVAHVFYKERIDMLQLTIQVMDRELKSVEGQKDGFKELLSIARTSSSFSIAEATE